MADKIIEEVIKLSLGEAKAKRLQSSIADVSDALIQWD
jgi:hypothetical protein